MAQQQHPFGQSPVEKLTAQHEVSKFKCGQNSLDYFLRKYALENQAKDLSQTYVTHRDQAVLGYYTLVYSSVALEDAPSPITEGMPSHRPVPVMLLARWAVHRLEQGKGVGRALLKDAFLRTAHAADIGGLRAILVDEIDDRMALFYRNHGFIDCPVGEHKLMISIQDVRISLAL
jgi:GNAT superfamily N-acetyltransferase